ncbi:Pimeloyl-ACP methyl ester carboxylesterase [Lentibacillus halodurans]|uniref:Pimeloyl-ACP methyl ester carboxylesterase n=1 Tax=Lentibacillus halodurans TaxID=237679 RepID=A0A1I0X4L0_9BACI|nr:alpha/beta hydrolase [Lentibacillus halodurans]SFA95306.1 Pimeloyl-ACP methyl ester carboxylesterase [Lentibacillus halodurans]
MNREIETCTIDGEMIEYSIIRGSGAQAIFVMHGGHSNCYEEFGYEPLVRNGFTIITPSRAGYSRTSSEIGESLSMACDHYAKILDYLNIEKVHLLAVSAGGSSGICFAACFPERVKTLILQSAVTKQWLTPKDKEYKAAHILFRPSIEKFIWKLIATLNNRFPNFTFKHMVPSFTKLSYEEVKSQMHEEDVDAIKRMNNRQRSGSGFIMDLQQTGTLSSEELQRIKCPTLLMHSRHDGSVPLEHAEYAQQHIQNSELCVLDTWGHLIWLGKGTDKVSERLLEFLNHHEQGQVLGNC